MSAKKRGRPAKTERKPRSLRTSSNIPGYLPEWGRATRESNLQTLINDPFQDHFFSPVFASLMLGSANDGDRQATGKLLCDVVELGSIEAMESVFASIVALKVNSEYVKKGQIHRIAKAYRAYCEYIETFSREPSKKQLREFIGENREKYTGFPPQDASDQWTEIWRKAGLSSLQSR